MDERIARIETYGIPTLKKEKKKDKKHRHAHSNTHTHTLTERINVVMSGRRTIIRKVNCIHDVL